jgi:signal transduction histidine kinase
MKLPDEFSIDNILLESSEQIIVRVSNNDSKYILKTDNRLNLSSNNESSDNESSDNESSDMGGKKYHLEHLNNLYFDNVHWKVYENIDGDLLKNYLAVNKIDIKDKLKIIESIFYLAEYVYFLKKNTNLLTPDNIIITNTDVRLIDNTENIISFTNHTFYPPEYIISSKFKTTEQEFVYSIAAIFYFILMDEPHFLYSDNINIINQLNSDETAITKLSNNLEYLSVHTVFSTALDFNPDKRYQTIKLFKFMINELRMGFLSHKKFNFSIENVDTKLGLLSHVKELYGKKIAVNKIKHILKHNENAVLDLVGVVGSGKKTITNYILNNILPKNYLKINVELFENKEFCLIIRILETYLEKVKFYDQKKHKALIEYINIESDFCYVVEGSTINYENFLIKRNNEDIKIFTEKVKGYLSVLFFKILDDSYCCFVISSTHYDRESKEIISKFNKNSVSNSVFIFYREHNGLSLVPIFDNTIKIDEFSQQNTIEFIDKALSYKSPYTSDLAKVVFNKTHGNPLLIKRLLSKIHKSKYLNFDYKNNEWSFNKEKIVNYKTPLSVIDYFYTSYLSIIIKDHKRLIEVASCFEGRFCLKIFNEVLNELSINVDKSLLKNIFQDYFVYFEESNNFMFTSDELKNKINQSMVKSENEDVNLIISQHILKNESEHYYGHLYHYLTRCFNQLCQKDTEEYFFILSSVSDKCLFVGDYLNAINNYQVIYVFSNKIALNEETLKNLLLNLCHCYCQLKDEDNFYKFYNMYVIYPLTSTEKIKVLLIESKLNILFARHDLALENAYECLALAKFPLNDLEQYNDFTTLISNFKNKHNINDLKEIDYAVTESQSVVKNAEKIISTVLGSLLIQDPFKMARLISRLMLLMFERNEFIATPAIFTTFGLVIIRYTPYIDFGYQVGELGYTLSINSTDRIQANRGVARYCNAIRQFKHPITSSLPLLRSAAISARKKGDLEYAAINLEIYCINSFVSGENLDVSRNHLLWALEQLEEMQQLIIASRLILLLDLLEALIGGSDVNHSGCFNNKNLNDIPKETDKLGFSKISSYQTIGCYFLLEKVTDIKNIVTDAPRTTLQILHEYVYCLQKMDSLTSLQSYENSALEKVVSQFKLYAELSPKNYKAKHLALEFKIHQLNNDYWQAWNKLSQGIVLAEELNNGFDTALLHELAYYFWVKAKDKKLIEQFCSSTKQAFAQWGCEFKVNHYKTTSDFNEFSVNNQKGNDICSLDKDTLIAAHSVINTEVGILPITQGLLNVLMDNSSADNICMLTTDGNNKEHVYRLQLSADDERTFSGPILLDNLDANTIEKTAFQLISNNCTALLSEDVSADLRLSDDPYLKAYSIKSLAAVPYFYKSIYKGLISLSSRNYRYLFSEQHIELLTLLVSQVSFSIENAKMYSQLKVYSEKLEQEVNHRTSDLRNTIEILTETQEQLVESKKLSALGSLVRGVAHEINTPLGISITALSHIKDELEATEEEITSARLTQASLQKHINSSLSGHELMVNNLSRINSLVIKFKQIAITNTDSEMKVFNLYSSVDEIVRQWKTRSKVENIIVDIQIEETISFYGFYGEFITIFEELLENSAQHAFKNTSHPVITISTDVTDEKVLIHYSDNGSGVTEQSAHLIFDPFFTTSRGAGCTGLGLNLVFNIITTLFEGKIELLRTKQGIYLQLSFPIKVQNIF